MPRVLYRDFGPSRIWPIPRAFNFYANFEKDIYWRGGNRSFSDLFITKRNSTSLSADSSGMLNSFAGDVPRLTDLGLLVEPNVTNLCIHSSDFAVTEWVGWSGQFTISSNTDIAPDGTLTADTFTYTNANTSYTIFQLINVTENTQYTFSYYAKLGTKLSNRYSVYNPGASTFIVPETTASNVIPGADWTRVSVTFTTPAGCTQVRVYPDRHPANISGPNGNTIKLWGAQLELGPVASSHVITTTNTVTTDGDVVKHNFGNVTTVAAGVGGVLVADIKGFNLASLPILLGFNPPEEVVQTFADEAMEATSMTTGINTYVFAASNNYAKVRRYGQSDIASSPVKWKSDTSNMSIGGNGFNSDNNIHAIFKRIGLRFDIFNDDKFNELYSIASSYF